MTLQFSLSAHDFLQYQLFAASRSDRIRLKRISQQAAMTIAFAALGVLFLLAGNKFMMICSFIVSLATLVLYPAFLRSQYKRHYQAFIADAYKNRLDKPVIVTFREDLIESMDETGESKILLSHAEEIFETGEHFYIMFRSGQALILPKQKLPDPTGARAFMQKLSEQLSIPFRSNPQWKWK